MAYADDLQTIKNIIKEEIERTEEFGMGGSEKILQCILANDFKIDDDVLRRVNDYQVTLYEGFKILKLIEVAEGYFVESIICRLLFEYNYDNKTMFIEVKPNGMSSECFSQIKFNETVI